LDYDYYKQVCVYGFTREALLDFAKLPRGKLEEIEDIEILRFIENGYKVKYIEVASNTIAVDTPNDLQKVIEVFKGKNK
jgi:3-deoxy-manno-octulosonate cytidylyltransferase (CMP-KDO synthetase)